MMNPNVMNQTRWEPWIHVLGTVSIEPGNAIAVGDRTMVPYRPAHLKLSTKRSALLSVEMRKGQGSEEVFPLGMIDLWSRTLDMRSTCSIFDVRNLGELTSYHNVRLVITNHGRFKCRVYAEIEGIREVQR